MSQLRSSNTALLDRTLADAFEKHKAGELPQAEDLYRRCLAIDPENVNALQLLGALKNQSRHFLEACTLLQNAAAFLDVQGKTNCQHAALYHNLGRSLSALGRNPEAIAQFRRALDLDAGTLEFYLSLADELSKEGEFAAAVATYQAARLCGPLSPIQLCRLGTAYAVLGRYGEAELAYRDAVELFVKSKTPRSGQPSDDAPYGLAPSAGAAAARPSAVVRRDPGSSDQSLSAGSTSTEPYRDLIQSIPANADTYYLLARALQSAGDSNSAIGVFRSGLQIDPEHVATLYELGVLLVSAGYTRLAVPLFEKVVNLRPDFSSFHIELGNALHSLGHAGAAYDCHRRAQELQPVRTAKSNTTRGDFSVLAIDASGAGNTPSHFLLSDAPFDCHFFSLLPGLSPDIALLRGYGDVILNLTSDVDQGRHILPQAMVTTDQLGKRVFNHPRKIFNTDRDVISDKLSKIPLCRSPRTIRLTYDEVAGDGVSATLARHGLSFSALLRVPGSHGGEAFEKIDSQVALDDFVNRYIAEDYYVSEFVEYRSSDNLYRKYRFIFVGGDIYPYHLAIGSSWKVHHYNTEVEYYQWMQKEEEAFLNNPWATFLPEHQSALHEIYLAIDLDFFGVDCSIDRSGNVVVFEANASMLVHGDNGALSYKTPHCVRIKEAFQRMLIQGSIPHAA